MERAYSLFTIKSVDESDGRRAFKGIASTPATDRIGDIVESKGAQFKLPLPLLWQHSAAQPIGWVRSAVVSDDGIPIDGEVISDAELAAAGAPQSLRDEIARAWVMIKTKLVRGLSIGFRGLDSEDIKGTWGIRFKKWEWLELSAVTIPANMEATIHTVKSLDDELLRAASGASKAQIVVGSDITHPPGVAGTTKQAKVVFLKPPEGPRMKTVQEQITDTEARRQAAIAKMNEVMSKAAEQGRTFDATEKQVYDDAKAEERELAEHLGRLHDHAKALAATAKPVNGDDTTTKGVTNAPERRTPIITNMRANANLPKGTAFTRYAMALMLGKGNLESARAIAEQWKDSTPEVRNVLQFAMSVGSTKRGDWRQKAAVAAGDTTTTDWAAPLVQLENMADEFIELLRPETIIGRIPGFRRVPFHVRIPRQTAGSSGQFVGEGAPKPVNALALESITMAAFKAAVIVVMTQELVRFSNPSAEALVRNDMIAGIRQYLDERFIDPQYGGVANVSPASITNGVTPITATGTTIALTDTAVEAAMSQFVTNNLSLNRAVWIMSPVVALSLSLKRTSQDVYAYPTINANGGTWFGLPVITSNSVTLAASPSESMIVLLDPSEVLLADDGGVDLDTSTEASVQMDNAPAAGAQSLVSLWQNNLFGIRAEQFINWMRRRDNVVAVIRYNVSPGAV